MKKKSDVQSTLLAAIHNYAANTTRFYVAYSGGRDSGVLLHTACQLLASRPDIQLKAWHINHGLSVDADAWEQHCRETCERLNVPIIVSGITECLQSKESVEMFARRARYAIWSEQLPPDSVLLQGHHSSDQAETLLLQLLRGNVHPAGMPIMRSLSKKSCERTRSHLLRPFLRLPQEEIINYAEEHNVQYVEDTGNTNLIHDRNYIRHKVLPLISERWPAASANLALGAERLSLHRETSVCAHAKEILLRYAQEGCLHIPSIAQLEQAELERLLIAWLESQALPPAPSRLLFQARLQMRARVDASPVLEWSGGSIRRHRDFLYALGHLPPIPAETRLPLSSLQELPRPALGTLFIQKISSCTRGGLSIDKLYHIGYASELRNKENSRVKMNSHSRSFKKLLQESNIPSWLRPFVPILYQAGEVVAVVNTAMAAEFHDREGNALELRWRARTYGLK